MLTWKEETQQQGVGPPGWAGPSLDASEQISQARLAPGKAAKAGASARKEAGDCWKATFLDGGRSAATPAASAVM